jgi:hypothetical protein
LGLYTRGRCARFRDVVGFKPISLMTSGSSRTATSGLLFSLLMAAGKNVLIVVEAQNGRKVKALDALGW